jgi:eukaryotic-like serine/threonine-protein kinase
MAVCASCQSTLDPEARFCPECGAPAVKAPKRLGIGSELMVAGLGRAVLGHEIGEGGMGIVYRAWLYYDPLGPQAATPPHPVAVKVLNPLLRGRERARRLFAREAEALKRLAHPNIVHFFALAEDDAQTAIVMELVHGEPLSAVLQRAVAARPSPRTPAVPFLLAWHYFAQLLGALAAVHEIGILHRDVKPANVIARADGVIKLTDFGIARLPSSDSAQTGGLAAGTGAYMSPEAVRGEPQDPRSDLYAAAIVLYELLSGITPFDRPDRNELTVRTAQLEEAPAPITSLVTSAPPVLDVLFARALAKDPALRYGSAIELGEAFRTGLELPAGPGWLFQQELAKLAQTVSGVDLPAAETTPGVGPPAVAPTEPDKEARAEELRQDLVAAFQHPQTDPG